MINLQRLPVTQLKPAPYNPRIALQPGTPEYRRLERSLNEFDLVEPIVWNERTGHVVSGHQRLEVLKNKGLEEVDVSVVSLSLEREKTLNIALNNSRVGGDWDSDKLLEVVAELNELPEFDATLTGFDDDDLRDLLFIPDPEAISPPSPLPTDDNDDPTVRVILEIPYEDWEEIRPEIDRLLADFHLQARVKLPAGE